MSSWADLYRDALLENAVIDPIDDTPPNLAELARVRCNGILDLWNANPQAAYTVTFPTFTTTSGLSPHTIGVTANSPTWTVTGVRPVEILAANFQQGSGTSLLRIPIDVTKVAWWMNQALPQMQSGIQTQLFYSPTWPNGSVYLWPVPDGAYTIELQCRVVLAEVDAEDVTDDFSMPPGYRRALMLTLAKDLRTPLSLPPDSGLTEKLSEARGLIFGTNVIAPSIRTCDSGMPSSPGGGGFNYLTGRGAGR